MAELSAFDRAILDALVEGYRARSGLKERFQALSEYELARRVGIVTYSYVEFDASEERSAVRAALGRLQGHGLAQLAATSGRYETFLPTPQASAPPPLPSTTDALPAPADGQLEEVVRLLRSIDARLARLEAAADRERRGG